MAPHDSPIWRNAEDWASQQELKFTGDNWEDLARAAEDLADSLESNSYAFHDSPSATILGDCAEGHGTARNLAAVCYASDSSIFRQFQMAAEMARKLANDLRDSDKTMTAQDNDNSTSIEAPR